MNRLIGQHSEIILPNNEASVGLNFPRESRGREIAAIH